MKKLLFLLLLVMLLPCNVPAENARGKDGRCMSGQSEMKKIQAGQPHSLVWVVSDSKNGTISYEVAMQDGKLFVERSKGGKKTGIYVHPDLLQDFAACVRECRLEEWADFLEVKKSAGRAGCYVELGFADKRAPVTFRTGDLSALSDEQLARYKKAEKAFFSFADAVLARAEKAQSTVPAITEFFMVLSGPCSNEVYEVYSRLDKTGFVPVARTESGYGTPSVREAAAADAWIAEFARLLDKYQVTGWNGFSESDKDVLDGDSFSMHVSYAGGQKVQASGYMKFPDNFAGFRTDVKGLFDRLGLTRDE